MSTLPITSWSTAVYEDTLRKSTRSVAEELQSEATAALVLFWARRATSLNL